MVPDVEETTVEMAGFETGYGLGTYEEAAGNGGVGTGASFGYQGDASGGGGFIPSSSRNGYGNTGGGTGDGNRGLENGTDGFGRVRVGTFQPVTIHQLAVAETSSSDDTIVINNRVVGLVTFVGRILSYEEDVYMLRLRVGDCTGVLDVVYPLQPEHDQDPYEQRKREHIQDLAWVRVVGNANTTMGSLVIQAAYIRQVNDMNELIYHRLEVAKAYLVQTTSKPGQADVDTEIATGMSWKENTAPPNTFPQDTREELQGTSAAVVEYMRTRHDVSNGVGLHINDIARNVPAAGSVAKIRETLDTLCSDGHVYSTVDENHFRLSN